MARYKISYTSGATGYGWEEPVASRAEVKSTIKSLCDYTAELWVWDEKVKDHIYWKRCLEHNPRIDRLF